MKKHKTLLYAVVVLMVVTATGIGTSAGDGSDGEHQSLQSILFVHYADGKAPNVLFEDGELEKPLQTYYKLISKGMKWKTPNEYFINPNNLDSLGQVFIESAISSAITAWDSITAEDIFGSYSGPTSETGLKEDGQNTIMIPTPQFFPYVIDNIRSFLKNYARRLCIFEDISSKADDPWLIRSRSKIKTFQNEVYHLLIAGKHSDNEI